MATGVPHPYYPTSIVLPNYAPPVWTAPVVFGIFGAVVVLVWIATWIFSGTRRHLSFVDRLAFSWWAVTGSIHMVLEGAFAASPNLINDSSGAFLMDCWKEYAKSDSRYATRDPCIVAIEALTAFMEGPLCIVILYAMATRQPFSQLLQFGVSLGQLYGTAVYFATSYLEGFPHSDPHPLYFWGYFVGMNAVWVLVPGLILWRNAAQIVTAMSTGASSTTRRSKRD